MPEEIECISVFDMLKIGVGPSSSHTLGPWRAARRFIKKLREDGHFDQVDTVHVDLYGSLSLTGIGHATDVAVLMGLRGADPQTCVIEDIATEVQNCKLFKRLELDQDRMIDFNPESQIIFHKDFLPFHPNGIRFRASVHKKTIQETFYSIGGGFVIQEDRKRAEKKVHLFHCFPRPIAKGTDLLAYCKNEGKSVSQIVRENELYLLPEKEFDYRMKQIWDVMLDSMYTGCHTEGELPGGLNVRRRAYDNHKRLIKNTNYTNKYEWIEAIRGTEVRFREILKWVSCFALAVNEVNASLGRVVTAPTNGSAGVIPAVIYGD
jgi:L-serine dehydratase